MTPVGPGDLELGRLFLTPVSIEGLVLGDLAYTSWNSLHSRYLLKPSLSLPEGTCNLMHRSLTAGKGARSILIISFRT